MLNDFYRNLLVAAGVGGGLSIILTIWSLFHFSQTGPRIRAEIKQHYTLYSCYALSRLSLWAFLIAGFFSLLGLGLYQLSVLILGSEWHPWQATASAIGAVSVATARQFLYFLLHKPSVLMASSQFKMSRLYPLWRRLTPKRLTLLDGLIFLPVGGIVLSFYGFILASDLWPLFFSFSCILSLLLVFFLWVTWQPEPKPHASRAQNQTHPNILMLGADTLRADHLGLNGYPRNTSPFLDELATEGILFSECFVPVARTAPSLVSFFTGTWPFYHGIRENFICDEQKQLLIPALPAILRKAGYETLVISDWSGSDFGKFSFAFETVDVPEDQWNLKYLIRQGPKDIRLFLSLFTQNRFGRRFLPEIYYLAGIPLTRDLGYKTRCHLSRLAKNDKPFLLNVFMGTTHPPFGSEYPYYCLFSDPNYRGESKFGMARLADPDDIIRSQKEPKEAFDLDQIIDLYDGCIRNFDHEVRRIIEHLRACQLDKNTIIVIYSDHGMEFFEHGTWGQGNNIAGNASPRVPLIIRDPRYPGRGLCKKTIRSIDLMPTLLDLCGLTIPSYVQGSSHAELVKGHEVTIEPIVYVETGLWLAKPPGQHPDHLTYPELFELLDIPDKKTGTLALKPNYTEIINQARDVMICKGRWKLVRLALKSGPFYQLFDIETDPKCSIDLKHLYPDIFAALCIYLNRQ